jgi:hypothetical protein
MMDIGRKIKILQQNYNIYMMGGFVVELTCINSYWWIDECMGGSRQWLVKGLST